jgi:NAD(P)-dependent dehydrogenase (short-subunit alcohol dehydrogenase family)
MKNLENKKIIIITGAGNGLGKELAEFFIKENHNIIIVDKKINKTKFKNKNFFFVKENLSNTQKIYNSIKKIIKSQKIDLLINNAKFGKRLSLNKETKKNFNNTFDINLTSHFFLIQKLINNFNVKNNGSCIINISSVAATSITNESPSYHFSKCALISMTKYLALHLGKKNIRSNCIMPGFILKKENLKKYYSKKNIKYRKIVNHILPSKNIGNSLDIYNLCNFLMKPESKFINGEIITLDGGSHTTKIDPFNLLFKYKQL